MATSLGDYGANQDSTSIVSMIGWRANDSIASFCCFEMHESRRRDRGSGPDHPPVLKPTGFA
ncbi:hypothetical protein ACWGTO_33450 [Mesorhizobium sp. PL10]